MLFRLWKLFHIASIMKRLIAILAQCFFMPEMKVNWKVI